MLLLVPILGTYTGVVSLIPFTCVAYVSELLTSTSSLAGFLPLGYSVALLVLYGFISFREVSINFGLKLCSVA